jgi:transposase-like protein
VIRSASKRKKLFPNKNSAIMVVYFATMQASKKWTMPIQNWQEVINRFKIIKVL